MAGYLYQQLLPIILQIVSIILSMEIFQRDSWYHDCIVSYALIYIYIAEDYYYQRIMIISPNLP